MAFNVFDSKGTPLDQQRFTWKELVQKPISKLDDDAFTRVRIILMNGQEIEALRFGHLCARFNKELRVPLARTRRTEQHQASMVNALIGADHSNLETTIGYEQVAVEVTAAVAQNEPDPYLAQMYRFGLLEDFDHLYRYSALLDRLEGKDANNITQCYTDIAPGRATVVEHRHPEDDVRENYKKGDAQTISKLHALTLVSGEYQTHDFYMNVGPMYTDPVARALYAEIASIEEQHVTHYESLLDPTETWLEQWVLHEANEAYNYYSCVQSETNPRIKAIWERFLDYELGQFNYACDYLKKFERRDPAEIFQGALPEPIDYKSQRDFVRKTFEEEVDYRALGTRVIHDKSQESEATRVYRDYLNSQGNPTETVSAGYRWAPGGELTREAA